MSAQLDSSQPMPLSTTLEDSRVNTTPTVFILLCPNLDIQFLKTESKATWPQESFPWFLKDQRLCAASSVHAGRVDPAYGEPAACNPAPSRVSTNKAPPETWALSNPALVDMEVEVGPVMFSLVNSALSTEEALWQCLLNN